MAYESVDSYGSERARLGRATSPSSSESGSRWRREPGDGLLPLGSLKVDATLVSCDSSSSESLKRSALLGNSAARISAVVA